MKPEGVVRRATPADIDSILALISDNPETILSRSRDEVKELLETTWVIEEAGRVAGTCTLEIYSKKICEVRTLAVDKNYRGKGYGSRLVEAAVAEAQRRGIPQILSITSSLDFFERCGFGPCLKEKYALFHRGTSGAKG